MTHRRWFPGTPGRYYMRREGTNTSVPFGEDYWREVTDPDGNRRDRTTERLQHIADLKGELKFVNEITPGRIVDVGCGLGFFLSGIDDSWEKHGVEVSEFAVRHARQWAEVQLGSLEDARYPDNHFDVVFMHHVIEHLEQPESTITEVRRVLTPGGRLVLGAPDFDSGCARLFGPRYRLLHDPTHISLFSTESMHRFLRAHGFLIEHVDYPYFETRHFTEENLLRMLDTGDVSPPFYGNFMTFYCRKPAGGRLTAALQRAADFAAHELSAVDEWADGAVRAVAETVVGGGHLALAAGPRSSFLGGLALDIWRQLEEAHNCDAATPPVAGSGHAVASGDIVLSFTSSAGGQGVGFSSFDIDVRINSDRDQSETSRSDEESVLRLPVLYGQSPAEVEAAVVGGLLQELWSRGVGQATP